MWVTFWNWFDNSETVLWSRFQVLFGAIVAVLMVTDMTPYLPSSWLPIWAILNGILTEYLRRRNNTVQTTEVTSRSTGVKSEIKTLVSNPPPTAVP